MSRTFQRLETFGTLSVRDNVLVAAEMRRGWSREKFDPHESSPTRSSIAIGLGAVARRARRHPAHRDRPVSSRSRARSPPNRGSLLLDEPSAGLNEGETNELGALLRSLAS